MEIEMLRKILVRLPNITLHGSDVRNFSCCYLKAERQTKVVVLIRGPRDWDAPKGKKLTLNIFIVQGTTADFTHTVTPSLTPNP
jgi:hypothetical protein